ncbi:MAG: 30S ribosomal protein S16 [Panacagrimonas sp.]
MVTIRLARAGAKKRPFYHVVAADKRSPRDGRFIERLGFYNPSAKGGEQRLVLDVAKLEQWKKNGAQVSDRVAYLVTTAPAPLPVAVPVAAPVEVAAEGSAAAATG